MRGPKESGSVARKLAGPWARGPVGRYECGGPQNPASKKSKIENLKIHKKAPTSVLTKQNKNQYQINEMPFMTLPKHRNHKNTQGPNEKSKT